MRSDTGEDKDARTDDCRYAMIEDVPGCEYLVELRAFSVVGTSVLEVLNAFAAQEFLKQTHILFSEDAPRHPHTAPKNRNNSARHAERG